jgi:hypothetical protein
MFAFGPGRSDPDVEAVRAPRSSASTAAGSRGKSVPRPQRRTISRANPVPWDQRQHRAQGLEYLAMAFEPSGLYRRCDGTVRNKS